MVDKKQLLSMELKDDINDDFEEPVGLTVYSTSKPTIFSFMSIFESLWRQTEMYTNERITKEKLIQSEQMEKEFINTAAHELRTPIQAITGFSELNEELFSNLLNLTQEKNTSSFENKEIAKLIGQIYNNQKKISKTSSRIHELINNLLDIARFESSGAIYIYKEKMDLTKEINNLITR
jgi:signal transduction histidine kinase